MRLLLDTHVLLWALSDPRQLDARLSRALVDPNNDVRVSAVSAWEIAIKQSLAKLTLPGPAEIWLPRAVAETGFGWIPVTPEDALGVRQLPWHHRDPFDRLLLAQAAASAHTLVTRDRQLAVYGVPLLLA